VASDHDRLVEWMMATQIRTKSVVKPLAEGLSDSMCVDGDIHDHEDAE
jgi:hypothetical protein